MATKHTDNLASSENYDDIPQTLSEREFNRVTKEFNAEVCEYPSHQSMVDLFEEQVERTPDNIALSTTSATLTYRELSEQIKMLSTWLQKFNLAADDLVGICLPRDTQLLVAQMAVQAVGAAYLPIDSRSPQDRIDYMLADASVKLVILDSAMPAPGVVQESRVVRLDDEWNEVLTTSASAIVHSATPDNLAYVIYTSGSTGKPKGVQITRKNLVNHLSSVQYAPPFSSDDIIIALTTVAFDISIVELYLPLMHGARIHLVDQDTARDGFLLKEVIEKEKITRIDTTPATFRLLLEAGWEGSPNLTGITGGEALPADLSRLLIPRLKSFWNSYGPTETTVSCTAALITDPELPITIGKPLPNYRLYILDQNGSPCAINTTGEICIAGDSTSRGYINQPELNEKQFCEDPFTDDGSRMYRTGDLGRWLEDGTIECLGRIDSQVKLRGYRIELGEIASLISEHPAVQYSLATIYKQDESEFLVAYIVLSGNNKESQLIEAEIMSSLKEALPPYMVPSCFTVLEELPTTANGKTDFKALPAPDMQKSSAAVTNPPQTATEKKIALLWQTLLGTNQISRDDNFFELGGHSLLAMRFVAQVRSEFGKKMEVRSLVTLSLAQISTSLSGTGEGSEKSSLSEAKHSPTQTPFFLQSNIHQLFASFHQGSHLQDKPAQNPILICQPIGHEHQRLQRAIRQLACELANSGRDVLRFDYAGTGDSSGNLDEMSVDTWKINTLDAIEWLTNKTKADSIDAVGIRFGSLMMQFTDAPIIERCVHWDAIGSGEQWIDALQTMTNEAMRDINRYRSGVKDTLNNELFGYLYNEKFLVEVASMQFQQQVKSGVTNTLMLNSYADKQTDAPGIQDDKSSALTDNLDEGQNWYSHSTADDLLITPLSNKRIVEWFNAA